jgi:DNA-binding CsgD family transcriptional regulator
LVGRDRELVAAAELLHGVSTGDPLVMLVRGEAGIGKSRLASAALATLDGARRLIGHCAPAVAGDIPFAPILEAVQEGLRDAPADLLARLSSLRYAGLSTLLPEPGASATSRAPEPAGEWERTRLISALVDLLFALADSAPTVLMVEDVHWADRETAHVLTVLARRMQHQRFGVLLTARDDEPAWTAGRHWLLELQRLPTVADLSLERLTRGDVDQLLGELLEAPIDSSVADWVAAVSEGNPYAVGELARAVRRGRAALPATLTESVLIRVQGISAFGQMVLELLATARRPMQEQILTAASGPDADAPIGLQELLDHRAVVPSGPDRFVLRHALLAEAVTAAMLPSQRRRRHEQLAEALSSAVPVAPAAEVAGHWTGAHRWTEALQWTVRAANEAAAVYGYASAAEHCESAAELWGRVAEPERVTGTTRWQLIRRAVEYWQHSGRYEQSNRIATALSVDGLRREKPPEAGLLLAFRAEALFFREHRTEAALAAAREAAAVAHATSEDLRQAVAVRAGLVFLHAGLATESLDVLTETSREGSASPALLAVRGNARIQVGDVPGGMEDLELALTSARDPFERARAGIELTDALWRLNRLRRVVEIGLPMLQDLPTAGVIGGSSAALLWNVATSLLESGRLADVDSLLAPHVRHPPGHSNKTAYLVHSRLLRLRGELDEAARVGALLRPFAATNSPEQDIEDASARAELTLLRGEPDRAIPVLSATMERTAGTSVEWLLAELGWLAGRACADVAVRARRSGDREGAARAVQSLERVVAGLPAAARKPGPEGLGVVVRGFAAALTAETARARGSEASGPWRAAVAMWRELDRPLHELYGSFRLAEELAASGARSEAQTLLEQTHHAAAAIGLRPLCADLAALARRHRLALGSPGAPEGPLTAREAEILALVAAGRSNQQIGARLYLSASTVRVHVSNILRKLQVTTRAEAAATAYRRGLLPPDNAT